MESLTCPPLAVTPRVSLLHCLFVVSSCVMPPPDADEEEWATVERRGLHLRASGRPFVAVLTRTNTITNEAYKDDPTILAWELINEPRCPSDPSGDTLQAWIEEMASYVKSIDPVHLLEIGVEGFYGPSTPELSDVNPDAYSANAGTDYIRNHRVPGIDLASVHVYSDTWLPHSVEDLHLNFVKTWMQQHIDDAANLLQMPILIGEFGVSLKDGKFNNEFREAFMKTVYDIFLSSWKAGVIGGGCLVWQLFPESAEHMDVGYAVIFGKSPSTLNLLENHLRSL
ncbi:hypothetical protein PR202_ga24953 [Eleusine coracana subsp. coracana]|uniref:mannan endo-1,4-beta-mannosidase n=1 Tax=Eleusine coracana subsp. coracana TaxID=191504 RepID=A0AAV5D9Y1_ELECO|nr:hypothetical protein PR202_ga24953 [Eleusine coracana subsp. coracana]